MMLAGSGRLEANVGIHLTNIISKCFSVAIESFSCFSYLRGLRG